MGDFLFSYDWDCRFIDGEIRGVKLDVARATVRREAIGNAVAHRYVERNGREYGYYPSIFVFKEDSRSGAIEPVGWVKVLLVTSWDRNVQDWQAYWNKRGQKYPSRILPDGSLEKREKMW